MIDFPAADLRTIYLHWTAGDRATTYAAYHVCVARDADGVDRAVLTRDPRANARDVRPTGVVGYGAHVAGRNSFALGIALCAMADATPEDFGPYPVDDAGIDALCRTAARAAIAYGIAIDAEHVRTHAEAAVQDGYFGAGADHRWDIARLEPSPMPLVEADAAQMGDVLRARIFAESLRA